MMKLMNVKIVGSIRTRRKRKEKRVRRRKSWLSIKEEEEGQSRRRVNLQLTSKSIVSRVRKSRME